MDFDWYFDFISPYAYLQFRRLPELPDSVDLNLKPVLFAGLLDYWGQLGPAEVPPKRVYTYRHVGWLAARQGTELRMPAAHPFNPLPALRLAWAAERRAAAIGEIYNFIWVDGGNLGDPDQFEALGQRVGVPDAAARVGDPAVKKSLRRCGEEAVAAGVFGVPAFVHDGVVLWGQDAIEMIHDWLEEPGLFSRDESQRLDSLPQAAERSGGRR